eukprot:10122211-Alexandrium_andersonii.AAC.1
MPALREHSRQSCWGSELNVPNAAAKHSASLHFAAITCAATATTPPRTTRPLRIRTTGSALGGGNIVSQKEMYKQSAP